MLVKTEQLLATNRAEVLAVAHALETHKTLTGDDVEAVIEGRAGPLIDGRPYADAGFLKSAEAYHDQAVLAHRNHARVEAPMPALDLEGPWRPPRARAANGPAASRNGGNARVGRAANPRKRVAPKP